MLTLILFGLFLLPVALGMPIAHAMLPAMIVTLAVGFDVPLSMLPLLLIDAVDQWIWLTMPLFLMMGNMMNASGITEKLVNFTREVTGHISGGLSHVGVATNILMAGMSGSCSADAAATGVVIIPAMKKEGYPAGYASMLISTSSLIGPLIPPSLGLIIIGVLGRLSILRLWLGGAVPGVIVGLSLILIGYIMAKKKGFPRVERKPSIKRMASTGLSAAPALVIPFVILGGMRLGVFSPTEAGAVGVMYVLVLGFLVFKKLDLQGFRGAALETAKLTGPIMWIIGMATLFGIVIGRLQVGPPFIEFLLGVSQSPLVFLVMATILILFLGCIMESAPILLIVYPLLHPAATTYSIDPIYFGVYFSYLVLVGQCTPPVGPGMFITNAIAKCTIMDYVREGWPLLGTQFLLCIPFIFFPQLITWLPTLVLGPRGG